jgi:hypothetical protein
MPVTEKLNKLTKEFQNRLSLLSDDGQRLAWIKVETDYMQKFLDLSRKENYQTVLRVLQRRFDLTETDLDQLPTLASQRSGPSMRSITPQEAIRNLVAEVNELHYRYLVSNDESIREQLEERAQALARYAPVDQYASEAHEHHPHRPGREADEITAEEWELLVRNLRDPEWIEWLNNGPGPYKGGRGTPPVPDWVIYGKGRTPPRK